MSPAGRDRRAPAALVGVVLVVVGLVVLVVALAGRGDRTDPGGSATPTSAPRASSTATVSTLPAGSTAPTTPDGLGVGWAPEVGGRTPLRGFGEVSAVVTGADGETCEVCLLAATTPAQRARGLMEVTDADLGGYDGMLFEFDEPVDGSFWMRNTPLPLSIAYFAPDGAFVSAVDMAPCDDRPDCPGYPAEGPYGFALEVPAGGLDELLVEPGSHLEVRARTCPRAHDGS